MFTQKQKASWRTRLWFAQECGWDEQKLEEISAAYGNNLIRIYNMENAEQERKQRLRSRRKH